MESITKQADKPLDHLAEDIQLSAIEPLSIPAALKYIAGRLTEKKLSMLAREIESIAEMIVDEPPEETTNWNILDVRDFQWILNFNGVEINLSVIAASTDWKIKNSIAILRHKAKGISGYDATAYMTQVIADREEYPVDFRKSIDAMARANRK